MKFRILGLVSLLFCANALASDFAGAYKCKGHDPYLNKEYGGTVTINPQGTVYRISMQYDTGETYDATGGPYDETTMSVVFQDVSDLKRVGLEQYHFSDDKKKIGGYWVYLGGDKLGSEVCERVEGDTSKAAEVKKP